MSLAVMLFFLHEYCSLQIVNFQAERNWVLPTNSVISYIFRYTPFLRRLKDQAAATPTSKMHFPILTASLVLLATTALSAPGEARTPEIVLSFAGATPEAFDTEIPPTDGTLFAIRACPLSRSQAIPLRHVSFRVSCSFAS